MFESSPIDQLAYGYDYQPWDKVPPETEELGRTFFPWMRFGLAVTLMRDGYFAHEWGDTWHGNDWWYDELDFDLGYPLGAPQLVDLGGGSRPDQIVNGSFEAPIEAPWSFWVDTGSGAAATLGRDTAVRRRQRLGAGGHRRHLGSGLACPAGPGGPLAGGGHRLQPVVLGAGRP